MTTYTRLYSAPSVSQTALDTFLQSDADPLSKVFAAALYSKPVIAQGGNDANAHGHVGSFGSGVEIVGRHGEPVSR